jgi:hypothetical protein
MDQKMGSRTLQAQPASEFAQVEGDGFTVELFFGWEPELEGMTIVVEGDSARAVEFLREFAHAMGWIVVREGLDGMYYPY